MELNILEKLENKEFVYACLLLLKNKNALSEITIGLLTNSVECHRLFSCSSGFSILQEIPSDYSKSDLNIYCVDNTGRQRYYKDIVKLNGKPYVVSNHWYGPNKSMPDNRTPFMTWVISKV